MNDMTVGAIVYSTKGRDTDSYYAVIEVVSADYVKIADGKYRTIEKPKLKKVKHLKWNGAMLDGIHAKLASGKQIFDAELTSALRQWKESNQG